METTIQIHSLQFILNLQLEFYLEIGFDWIRERMSQKKARTFDLQAMLGETLKTAQESSRETLARREEEEKNRQKSAKKRTVSEVESKAPKPAETAAESDGEDVGPALPPGFVIPNMQELAKKSEENSKKEDEEDSDSDSESDDEVPF